MLLFQDDPGDEPLGPQRVELASGEAIAFSVRAPGKDENEDAVALIDHPQGGVIAVADGMGGMKAGRRASHGALEALQAALAVAAREGSPLRHATVDGLQEANRAVLALGLGAGTTLAAVVVVEGTARPIHVGDAVVLHVGQRGRIKSQTIAHSPTGYAIEAGLLDEDAALQHEERHIVSNHVGMEGMRIEVGSAVPVAARDTLLVASDGLADNLTVQEIVDLVRKGPLEASARGLAELARRRMLEGTPEGPGHPDDLSFVLYRRSS